MAMPAIGKDINTYAKKENILSEGLVKYTWCPGNGTRYEIMVQRLIGNTDFSLLGSVSEGGWIVICGLTRQAHMFASNGFLSESYVAEKLKLYFSEDIQYVTELIRFATGRI
jgi:hypothetical protein